MQVVDTSPDHIKQFLSKPIRQDDIDEWFAASGGRPLSDTLWEAVGLEGMTTRSLLNEAGECICLWGLQDYQPGFGVVWLIATLEAEHCGRAIHRLWPQEVMQMHQRFPVLLAVAYGRNELHLKWLAAIGFRAAAVNHVGPSALPFITFVRSSPCAHQ